ncbi:hypothetical protein ASG12_08285 [Williamsia sp. Leaf354]|uniref:hypothetical protein n=1 Tax=Williamsia sp. Leaf354 TaxID=1736349 RepID=UPI0006FFE614|nr:hypothetical protein [Williamsia sp. Leaf354]KQR98438.1 hypothetical protein ASG12_08285 [Williamsia sp. Leaf354]
MNDTLTVHIDRASVAMGDDVSTHEEVWTYRSSATLDDLLVDIATSYVPPISGDAGWTVHANAHHDARRRHLGMIYCPVDDADIACRVRGPDTLLSAIAATTGLDIYVGYLTWDLARPASIDAMRAARSRHSTPLHRTRLADADAEHRQWQTVRSLRRLDADLIPWRRAWIRDAVLDTPRLPGVDEFVAAHLDLLYNRLSPASVALAVDLFGAPTTESKYRAHGTDLIAALGDPRAATLAMVLTAFEWTMTQKSWEDTADQGVVAYLGQLERWGYRLSPVEQAYAGRRSADDVIDEARRHRDDR